ncbi:MAG: helix-turn-helix transcriptional regulator [Clostridia bacterium]|nr:helix-turn-helix transcriptional regulator [Clostridia bacterium]
MFFENDNFNADKISAMHVNRAPNAASSGMRSHYALSYRVKGNSFFYEGEKEIEAKSDTVALVPPSSSYRLVNQTEELYVIHFHCDLELAHEIKLFTVRDKEKLNSLFSDIHSVFIEKLPGYRHKIKYLFYKLVYTIETDFASTGSSFSSKYLDKAVSYISKHLNDQGFTANSVARHLNISPVYLRKIFSSAFACSPKSYIDRAKTERALELLGSGIYTVGEVSEACGFSDVYYFSAFIKKHTGLSPKHHIV